ncbi:hypothetical protein [Ralstonia solanacearum]|uniref:Uncharacterized protein n=1 Tax=Ralstonia solanacearum TaxID=305 RepID=A0AAE3NED4_RALSL|nr:hypothetical protein [Ralstonia solanacearum]MBB6583850.1 hypothetical protein [Ralstonia solanacearum]MDB0520400.1 hypothetical protein [Ralstonia solanacearum]
MTQARFDIAPERHSAALEKTRFDHVAAAHAQHLPREHIDPPRDARAPEEWESVIDHAMWNAAHEHFIVQLASAGLDRLFRDAPDIRLALSHRIGDGGLHAVALHEHIRVLSCGVYKTAHAPGTRRHNLFGGGARLPDTHPGPRHRRTGTPQPSAATIA